MTQFLVVSVEEMEILAFAVSRTIREHRQALGQIIAERERMTGMDRRKVLAWKSEHHDNLIRRIERLELMSQKLDMAPDASTILPD